MAKARSDEQAKRRLAGLLRATPRVFDRFRDNTGEWIDADQLAADLIEWFNVSELEPADIMRLLSLARAGRFQSWECPTCRDGTRVFVADPDNWGHFQGVHEADYASFPGYGIGPDDKRCDDCRMNMVGQGYIPEGMHLEFD